MCFGLDYEMTSHEMGTKLQRTWPLVINSLLTWTIWSFSEHQVWKITQDLHLLFYFSFWESKLFLDIFVLFCLLLKVVSLFFTVVVSAYLLNIYHCIYCVFFVLGYQITGHERGTRLHENLDGYCYMHLSAKFNPLPHDTTFWRLKDI